MSQSRDKKDDIRPNLSKSHGQLSRMILQGRSFSGLERHCSFLNTIGSSDDGKFATISSVSGLDFADDGRALAVVDWDQDGDLDLWFSSRNAPRIRLMQNRSTSENNYISLGLQGNGTTTSRDAIGARVEVVLADGNDEKNIQTLRGGEGFLSQDSKWLHYGLGKQGAVANIIVSWPGGTKEVYIGPKVNGRYTLVQGQGIAVALAPRPSTQMTYQHSEPLLPQPAMDVRIPLMTKLPNLYMPIRDFKGKAQIVEPGIGGPVLVTLWASWCPTCKEELTEFSRRKEELSKSGIGLLALSVDGLGDHRSDLAAGKKLLKDISFPYPVGFATKELVQKMQDMHDLIMPLKMPLPVPTSFLFDGNGELAVIYKGRADVDTLLRDVLHIKEKGEFTLEDISPFEGASIGNKELDRVVLANTTRTLFKRAVSLADKREYKESILNYIINESRTISFHYVFDSEDFHFYYPVHAAQLVSDKTVECLPVGEIYNHQNIEMSEYGHMALHMIMA